MNFKFAKNGTVIIAKIIKMTVLSQRDIALSKELVTYRNLMAAFTAKLPTHGWCAGLSNVSGAYESPSSRFNAYGCTNFLSTLC